MAARSFFAAVFSVLALSTGASAQVTFEARASEAANGDGTLWFQSLGGTSKGFAQLATHRLTAGAAALQGIYNFGLKWTDAGLYAESYKDGALLSSAQVFIAAGQPLLDCSGVATLQGGHIVTLNAGVPSAIRPHGGALVWTRGANPMLFAVEVNNNPAAAGAIVVQPILAGTVFGAAVVASKMEDVNLAAAVLDSHVIGEVLAYTGGNLFRLVVDLSDGAIPAIPAAVVLDPAGAAINGVLGIVELNSGFSAATVPSTPEGAAVLWNANNVFLYESRFAGGAAVTSIPFAGGPIVGCWGVASLHTRSLAGTIPAATASLEHAYKIFTANGSFTGKGIVVVEDLINNAPFPTSVIIPANTLIKRQAGSLYEIQARSTTDADGTRGFVIGHNQRSR